jgi:dTDP-4-dehydrorhamnose reductase
MKKILVTGANGFVGQSLVKCLLAKGHTVIAIGKGPCRITISHPSLIYYAADLTHPFEAQQVITREQPQVILHCAALTQADDCELLQQEAHVINVEATARLLLDAELHGCFFILLSTDFVFDGQKGLYSETDAVNPISWYGHTKVEAEAITETAETAWAIIRTCLVYGEQIPAGRQNIFSWIKSNLSANKPIKVVDDQWRTPTWVQDLATGVEMVIARQATGVWHLSGADYLSPYQMATTMADYFEWDSRLIERVNAGTFSQPAKRPAKTGFDISKAKTELGFSPGSFINNLQQLKD